MKNAIWREYQDFKIYRFQVHGKEMIKKVKRRKGWSQTAYGWDVEGKDVVIFTKYFRYPSDARKEAKSIDPDAEYLD